MPRASLTLSTLPDSAEQALTDLGIRLHTLRIAQGLTIRQMAERLLCSINTYRHLEAGKPTVSIGLLAGALWILQELESMEHIAPVKIPLPQGKRAKRKTNKLVIQEDELDF